MLWSHPGMQREVRGSVVPAAWISGCQAAHARLHALAERITEDVVRQDTMLEGWTVGHLLTHLARNADSHRGMVEAAQEGEIIAQYPGGPPQRNADIERGCSRSASDLVADLIHADDLLERAWSTTSERVWVTGLGLRRYGPTTLADFVFLRWREVEIHLVDFNLTALGSPQWDGLSPEYISLELQELGRTLAGRVPDPTTIVLAPGDRPSRAYGKGDEVITIGARAGNLIAWLMGRGGDPSWPVLGPWE